MANMKKLFILIMIMSWSFGLTGNELVQKMEDRITPNDSKVDMVMTLTNKKGKSRSSSLRSITKDDGAKQIIWFLSPADDKGVSFLKIEHDGKDDEMRMWLPAFKKIRRISAKKRSDSFMGSDMSYEDMSTRQLDEFNFKILGDEIFQGVPCHLLESKPKEHIRTEYSRHITWVDSTIFIPLKEESYDKTGKLLKEKYFTYKVIKKYHILTEVHVTNIQKNHSTTLKFENIELDRGVEDSFFHERYLKRLPK
jgi:outer membrane lipoprotein-sorting protein